MIGNKNILPPGYVVRRTIDLKTDRKIAAGIQAAFVAIALALVGLALVLGLPLSSGFSIWVTTVMTIAACLGYMIVHELTQPRCRKFSATRPDIA